MWKNPNYRRTDKQQGNIFSQVGLRCRLASDSQAAPMLYIEIPSQDNWGYRNPEDYINRLKHTAFMLDNKDGRYTKDYIADKHPE